MKRDSGYEVNSNVHPGYIVKMELKARGIKQKDFAEMLSIQASHLSELLKGSRNLNEQLAKSIASILNIPAAHLMQIQAEYDYKKRSAQIEDRQEHEAEILLTLYNELYDMRVLCRRLGINGESSTKRLDFCKEKLHFGPIEEQRKKVNGFYHRSEKTGLDSRMIATWTVLAQYEVENKPEAMGSYDVSRMDDLASELAIIFNDNINTENRVSRKLSEYGIKFCVVPKLDRASIDGYSFISNGQPSIAITKRFNRIDNMAFAVLHEVGHLKLHIKGDGERVTVANVDADVEDLKGLREEKEANSFATQALLPDTIWNDAPQTVMSPQAIQRAYSAWARKKGLNPWIVLGRISHDTGMYMFKSDKSREIQ